MRSYNIAIGLALTAFLLPPRLVRADVAVPPQDGITVLARGPVHEAFAQPMETNPQPGAVLDKQPPDPVPETPAEQKPEGDKVQWIPGYWAWDTDRNDFLWVSGFWRVPPPERRWVPGHWTHVDGGWDWSPGFWANAGQEQLQYLDPPPASLDNGPTVPAPDENHFYMPGIWVNRASRYVWRPGSWCAARPGQVWCPARYSWTPAGCTYVDGYWDYPLEDRGLLCAPVAFTQPLWTTPGWSYQPSCTANLAGLFASLFVRPAYGSHYFGDYYGAGYAGLGFQPWYAYGPRRYDPLFNYYGWVHHGDRGWYRGLQDLHSGRLNGSLAVPPRTLVQQNTLFRNTTVLNNTTNIINNLTNRNTNLGNMVTPINQIRQVRGGHLQLASLSAAQLAGHRSAASQMRDIAWRRSQFEKPGTRPAGGTPLPVLHPGQYAARTDGGVPGPSRTGQPGQSFSSKPGQRQNPKDVVHYPPPAPGAHPLGRQTGFPPPVATQSANRPVQHASLSPRPAGFPGAPSGTQAPPRLQGAPLNKPMTPTQPRLSVPLRSQVSHQPAPSVHTAPRAAGPAHRPAASLPNSARQPVRTTRPMPRSMPSVAHAPSHVSSPPRPHAAAPPRPAPASHGGGHGGSPAHGK